MPALGQGLGWVFPGTGTQTELKTDGTIATKSITLSDRTDKTVAVYTTSGELSELGPLTDGQVVIGSTGNTPAAANITSSGGSITITNGAGTINLEAVSGGILTWTAETGATKTMAINNGYITNRGGGINYTIPSTAAVGSVIRVAGLAGLWTISQNASESIVFGNQTTTVGVGGSLAATNVGDAVELLCIVADTTWTVISSVGSITVT